MRESELAAIADRAVQATSGPWTFNGICAVWQENTHVFVATTSPTYSTTSHASKTQQERNGTFIANARQDVPTLLQQVRELQGQVADLWDESRAYELGRMAERGKILATMKEIRAVRHDAWDNPFSGDPVQIALDVLACQMTGPCRPLPHPEQIAAENNLLRELAEATRALVSAMKAPRTIAGLPWRQVMDTLERLDALDRAKP